MKILIIGCNGFLGKNFSDFFSKKDLTVYGCDTVDHFEANITYFKTNLENDGLDVFLQKNEIDICINAAGSGNVGYSFEDPLADFNSNSSAVARILNLLKIYQPRCKFIHISSAAVYGNPASLPVNEKNACKPISPYGYHKWISEIICKEYYELFGIPISIVRPFSVYGEGQKKQLFWDLCKKLDQSDEVYLFGTGKESRDFIHAKDLAKLLLHIIRSSTFSCNIFNAASGIETSIAEAADIFIKNYKGRKKIFFSGKEKTGDPSNWRADVSLIKNIGYTPSMIFEEGIENYIKWFEANH
jgi:dTDP-glucose 4,6-dehydratase/UDP-glucose 4-epimerase